MIIRLENVGFAARKLLEVIRNEKILNVEDLADIVDKERAWEIEDPSFEVARILSSRFSDRDIKIAYSLRYGVFRRDALKIETTPVRIAFYPSGNYSRLFTCSYQDMPTGESVPNGEHWASYTIDPSNNTAYRKTFVGTDMRKMICELESLGELT